jgi:hypothetical protein
MEEALPHHIAALATHPRHPEYRQFYLDSLVSLTQILAALGDHAVAIQRAEKIAELGYDRRSDAYHSACVLSRCIPHPDDVKNRTEGPRAEQAEKYAARAIKMLCQAIAKGYTDISHLLDDRDLVPLRGQADYAELLWDLVDMPAAAKP